MAQDGKRGPSDSKSILEFIANQSQLDFEIDFYGRILNRRADYVNILRAQAHNLSEKGCYVEGLDIDKRLVKLCPKDPLVHYNLACSYSLLRMKKKALDALKSALDLGYRDFEHMLGDEDLENLHLDARFRRLVHRYWTEGEHGGQHKVESGDAEG